MNARPKESAASQSPAKPRARGLRLGPGGRWLAIAGGIALVTGVLAYGVWRQVRTHVLASRQYQLDPQQIAITPPPPWIRTNVKEEVMREASLSGPLSLLDTQLTARVAGALAAHPWIADVLRVSKRFPSGLEAEVVYRRPVAMVEVPDGALPVDVEGVVLPTGDFRAGEPERYPRIGGISTSPSGIIGSHWGDAAVVGGAEIAAALGNDWHSLGLFRIVPVARRPGGRGGVEYAYAVFTLAGTRIDWGLAPGTTISGEPAAADKIAQLRRFTAEHGSLDGPRPQQLHFTPSGQLEAISLAPVAPPPKRTSRREAKAADEPSGAASPNIAPLDGPDEPRPE
jgi:hypothetical protein